MQGSAGRDVGGPRCAARGEAEAGEAAPGTRTRLWARRGPHARFGYKMHLGV